MTDLALLAKRNAARFAAAKLTRGPEFASVAIRLAAAKAKVRYQAVEAKTGVPWYFVAVTHEREASQRWDRQLGQGDPLGKKSTHEPIGRGPFLGPNAWEDAAVDALVNCPPHAARNKDWSIGGLLTMLEQYNGLGYAGGPAPSRGPNAGKKYPPQASPYVWSGTDQYRAGKYVADHDFRPEVVDSQTGCAGLLLAMQKVDPSITLGVPPVLTSTAAPTNPVVAAAPVASAPSHPALPQQPAPATSGWLSALASSFAALFTRKA